MTTLDFAAAIDDWVRETEQRMSAVFRSSAQAIVKEMSTTRLEGGRLPILTGNLRRSLMVSTAAMPTTASGDTLFPAEQDYNLTIATAQLGDKIYAGFQAAYARRQEYGFSGQDTLGRIYNSPGKYFVASAVLRWPEIVREQTAIIRGRVQA